MKKILSLMLALLMALSCTSLAFAAEDEEEEVSPEMKALGEYIMNHQAEAFKLAVEGFKCQSEKVEAEILTDGTVNITEYWTYSCRNFEKMTKFERTLLKSDDYQISNIRVMMGADEMEHFDSYAEIEEATRREEEEKQIELPYPQKKYTLDETDAGYDINAYLMNWNATTTIKVLYTVTGPVKFHNDIMEFNWQLIGDNIPYEAGLLTGYVILPYGAERKEVKAWTHDQEDYALVIESGELVGLTVNDVPARHPVDIRVTAPLYLFPDASAAYKTGEDAYMQILQEENDPDQDPAYTAREERKDRMVRTAVPIVLVGGAALILIVSRIRRRKKA